MLDFMKLSIDIVPIMFFHYNHLHGGLATFLVGRSTTLYVPKMCSAASSKHFVEKKRNALPADSVCSPQQILSGWSNR
jgi:hypothetical protein